MHPRSEIDQELVLRVAGGDPDALDEIYGRYARSVYGLAYRILGDASAAEDVVQDAFLALHRRWAWIRRRATSSGRTSGTSTRPRASPCS